MGENGEGGHHLKNDSNIAAKRQRTGESQRSPTRRNNSQTSPAQET